MKKLKQTLCLLLAFLLLIPSLVACNGSQGSDVGETSSKLSENERPSGSETESEFVTDALPDIEKNEYGTEFFLSIHPDSNPLKYYWVEESDDDVMSSAIYHRQELLKDYLGVEILATNTGSMLAYVDSFKSAVKNKDGSVDALITHVYFGIDGFITENYLQDFQNIRSIDLSADYWNERFMEDLSINDKMYLGFGDFNIMYTHVVAFNKEIMDKYDDALDESVYEMVENYRWTLDSMISLANLVYIDETANGKTMDDSFGIIANAEIAFSGFLHSSNVNLIEQNESGEYAVSVMNELNKEKTSRIVDSIKHLFQSDCAWYGEEGYAADFCKGKALLSLTSTYNLPNYLNYDIQFGVLPYPLYDENQKDAGYRSLQWGGYLCVPSYVRDINMVGDALEVISFYSEDVNNAFYEKLLGKQVAESPIDKRMLEIVWDGVCSDFGQTFYYSFYGSEILYLVSRLAVVDTTKELGSFTASAERVINKSLKKLFSKTS